MKPSPKENSVVMVVDDDQAMRLLLRRSMEQEGYKVVDAKNGQECLDLFETFEPDLILIDGIMPVMDGFEACARLQKMPGGEQVPVLMITGLDNSDAVDEAFKAGATDYITKPIHWAVLRQRVRRLLASKRMEELRDDLTQMIVHDMKNPISNINGYAGVLIDGLHGNLSEPQRDSVSRIYRNSIVLLDMMMMILDLKKMEEGKLNLERSAAAVLESLEQIIEATNWMAQNRQIKLEIDCEDRNLVGVLDWKLISRVLTNLVTNAIKHSPRKTSIILVARLINAEAAEPHLYLAVKDQGEGIALQDQVRIFEKYAQADGRKGGSRTDTGLGLTFCKLAIEAHGGTIQLESELGHGSTFSLLLPANASVSIFS